MPLQAFGMDSRGNTLGVPVLLWLLPFGLATMYELLLPENADTVQFEYLIESRSVAAWL